jgi:hypothetical protein
LRACRAGRRPADAGRWLAATCRQRASTVSHSSSVSPSFFKSRRS